MRYDFEVSANDLKHYIGRARALTDCGRENLKKRVYSHCGGQNIVFYEIHEGISREAEILSDCERALGELGFTKRDFDAPEIIYYALLQRFLDSRTR